MRATKDWETSKTSSKKTYLKLVKGKLYFMQKVESAGSYVEVQCSETSVVGYVRKEYLEETRRKSRAARAASSRRALRLSDLTPS